MHACVGLLSGEVGEVGELAPSGVEMGGRNWGSSSQYRMSCRADPRRFGGTRLIIDGRITVRYVVSHPMEANPCVVHVAGS